MPNDCWNKITMTGSAEDLNVFFVEEFKNVPEWAYSILVRTERGIQFKIWSAWKPDFNWLETLLLKYPSIWIKNLWSEEGGYAGVWIGSTKGIQRLAWEDLCMEEYNHIFG
jgi:hypothetical protein